MKEAYEEGVLAVQSQTDFLRHFDAVSSYLRREERESIMHSTRGSGIGQPESIDAERVVVEPNPEAHADLLLLDYGPQHARWIAESNVGTARPSDREYWIRVAVRLRQESR